MTGLRRSIGIGLLLALPFWAAIVFLVGSCSTLHAQQTGAYRSTRVFALGDTTVTEYVRGNVDSVRRVFPKPTPEPTPTPPVDTVVIPPPSTGIPLGASGLEVPQAPFSASLDATTCSGIIADLNAARRLKVRRLLNMTGGKHAKYMTAPPPTGKFSLTIWKQAMDCYGTPPIKAAVAAAVADGTIIGNSVMDEPGNVTKTASWGTDTQGNTIMSKAIVDQMCAYVKGMFPTLQVGVVHDHRVLDPATPYKVCDFLMSQYRLSKGTPQEFRDGALAFTRKSKMAYLPSINILDGGVQIEGCPRPLTGGPGTYGDNCQMTPDQWESSANVLGPAGCALNTWRYEKAVWDNAEYQTRFKRVATKLSGLPGKSCRRTT